MSLIVERKKNMYDVIIVGSGVAGAVAARVLAEEGKEITVIETFGEGKPSGNGNATGKSDTCWNIHLTWWFCLS